MKRIKFKHFYEEYLEKYPKDIERIVKMFAKRNIRVTSEEAAELWSIHSASWAADWLYLDDDDSRIFEDLISMVEVVDEDMDG